MATNYISSKLRTYLAQRFKNTFVLDNSYHTGFVFIAKSLEYANGALNIDNISDTVYDEKTVWDNMIVAKKISPSDVELVIPRYDWVTGTVYKEFDDTVNLEDLLTEDVENDLKPMYVLTDDGNVYKCLNNNLQSPSTIKPTGNYNSANGFIPLSDGYIWKYMYNIVGVEKFTNNLWIPVPYSTDKSSTQNIFETDDSNLVDGSLNHIIVTNPGSGYVDSEIEVLPFSSDAAYLTINGNTAFMNVNMEVSGTGILPKTYITSKSTELNRLYLSYPTIAAGGGPDSSNTISVFTRAVVEGDGSGVTTQVHLSGNTISKIDVETFGVGFTKANVKIYGSGTGATARAVLPIKYGHGYSPAIELGAKTVFVDKVFGEVDSSEGGLIPTTTTYRQYGILMDPHKYGQMDDIAFANANSVVVLTTNITLLSGSLYTTNEKVYQGPVDNPTFYGYVNSQSQANSLVRLTNTYGDISTGSNLIGEDSGVTRIVANYTTPELEPYSGDIIYVKNGPKTQRFSGQSEEIKFIIKF